jgi:hypothetical protein
MFAKASKRRESYEDQDLKYGLQEKDNMEESAMTQESVGKEERGDKDTEMQAEKKLKLESGDPVSSKLVFIVVFCSF